jgi:hypothetical protein
MCQRDDVLAGRVVSRDVGSGDASTVRTSNLSISACSALIGSSR